VVDERCDSWYSDGRSEACFSVEAAAIGFVEELRWAAGSARQIERLSRAAVTRTLRSRGGAALVLA
jgi:hypothetical protein